MPPRARFTRGDILSAAFRITRARGVEAVNARDLAKELGCSTQPIFREFQSMDQIRHEMLRMAMDVYNQYIGRSSALSDKPYLGTGLAYILMAREEPALFKFLFMRDRVREGTVNQQQDDNMDYITDLVMRSTGFDREQATRFHMQLWVYAHGLATMIATNFVRFEPDEIVEMMRAQYRATLALFQKERV